MAQAVKASTSSDTERDELQNGPRRSRMPAEEQQHVRMILPSMEGLPAREIGERVGVWAKTVGK